MDESSTGNGTGISSDRSSGGTASTEELLINALIGAVVTVLLSFLVFSPVVGGAVAGYLRGRDGIKVGAISGLIAVVPLFLLGFLFVSFVGLFAVDAAVIVLFFVIFGFVFLLLFSVVLSALGGFLGVYLADEFSA